MITGMVQCKAVSHCCQTGCRSAVLHLMHSTHAHQKSGVDDKTQNSLEDAEIIKTFLQEKK